ncbi:cell division ATP-binding protein FtsE [Natranaerovirga hydrolytica]|uniref:Cell division ATP-binding protein FtsE n=1 Tax=Natranaerovirga hydrolytica TaxID=680378 RepID=A0A4R1MSB0_9FIRM|nr:cell division ATP-binding protein FtsE [Natranaerovirga hydrolytica]TCK93469.1 cell division ATP-binding protein FtsE [Natranaerovirga hydrolytica]
MIHLENVSKVYENGTKALDNINIKIEKGEFVFVVGSSGSGKSTFVKLLLKEIEPTEGKIFLKNKNLGVVKRKGIPKLRREMGIVFQDFRLLKNMTVYENIAFALKVTEASKRKIRRQVPMVMSMVGLADKAKNYPNQLSGGEQQRVALARALVNNPVILLADEPTGNLDPKTSWEIMKLLDEINKRGTTVLLVTHDKEIVNAMQKRVITLSNGKVIGDIQKGGYDNEN